MGNQIIRQPDGLFAVFSHNTDTIAIWDASAVEVVDHFADLAAEDARRAVREKLRHVVAGEQRKAYHQFAMTWDEALISDCEHGGDAWEHFPVPVSVPLEGGNQT